MELLTNHKTLLNGLLGKWEGYPYHIELREGTKTYHANLYIVTHVYEYTLHMEVGKLCKVEVLPKQIGQSGQRQLS